MTEISILNQQFQVARPRANNRRQRRSAPHWSKSGILETALGVPGLFGSAGLDVIVLARRLAIPVATLYAHFGSREGLMDALARQAEIELYKHDHRAGVSWEVELRTHYHAVRASLHRRPHLADFLFYAGQAIDSETNTHLRHHVHTMASAGIEPDLAVRSLRAMTGFTVAFVTQTERVEGAMACRQRMGLRAVSDWWSPRADYEMERLDFDEQFEISLELMLRGLQMTTRGLPQQSDGTKSGHCSSLPSLSATSHEY